MTVIKNDVILKFNNTGSNRYPITFEYDEPQQVQVRTYNEDTNEYEDITTFEFDGPTTLVFTGVVPDTFEIVRVTDISQSYGTANFSQFVPSSAIKAADLNGNLELLRQAIEENSNSDDNLQDQIDDINQDIDDINNTIDGLDNVYVNVTGDTMTGALSMSDNYVRNVKDPQFGTDAVNLSTLQTALDGLPGGDLDAPPYVRESFTATAGQTVFTLNAVNDFTDGREQVYLNGNLLNRSTDYSTTSLRSVVNTVTLAYGAHEGDVLEILCINYLISLDGQTDLTANNIKYTYPGGVDQTVQSRLEQYVSVKDFGAKGDGVTDDSDAIKAAIEAADGAKVHFESGKVYRITKTLDFAAGLDINISSNGSPATLNWDSQIHGFRCIGTQVLSTTLTNSQPKYSRTWTLDSTTGLEPGMLMEVESDKEWYYDPRGRTHVSELHKISDVTGSTVRTYIDANDGYNVDDNTITVTFYKPINVEITNLIFKAPKIFADDENSQRVGIDIGYADNARVTDVVTDSFQAVGLMIRGCYGAKVSRHVGIDANYWTSGYGAETLGSTVTTFSNCLYRGCRRGIDVNGLDVISLHTNIVDCVCEGGGYDSKNDPFGFQDNGTTTGANINYGFGSHGPADKTTYTNCTTYTRYGINCRGGNEVIQNCNFFGHVTSCVSYSYGRELTVKNCNSRNSIIDKDTTRYDGGVSVNNNQAAWFVKTRLLGDNAKIHLEGNSGYLSYGFFTDEDQFPSEMIVKDNTFLISRPDPNSDIYILDNEAFDTDGVNREVKAHISNNSFTLNPGPGQLYLEKGLDIIPVNSSYSGLYTPVFTDLVNINDEDGDTIANFNSWRYEIHNQILKIWGKVFFTVTTDNGRARFEVSLPLRTAVNFSSSTEAIGQIHSSADLTDGVALGTIYIDTVTDLIQVDLETSLAGTRKLYNFEATVFLPIFSDLNMN